MTWLQGKRDNDEDVTSWHSQVRRWRRQGWLEAESPERVWWTVRHKLFALGALRRPPLKVWPIKIEWNMMLNAKSVAYVQKREKQEKQEQWWKKRETRKYWSVAQGACIEKLFSVPSQSRSAVSAVILQTTPLCTADHPFTASCIVKIEWMFTHIPVFFLHDPHFSHYFVVATYCVFKNDTRHLYCHCALVASIYSS